MTDYAALPTDSREGDATSEELYGADIRQRAPRVRVGQRVLYRKYGHDEYELTEAVVLAVTAGGNVRIARSGDSAGAWYTTSAIVEVLPDA